jgi:hypothetical protein
MTIGPKAVTTLKRRKPLDGHCNGWPIAAALAAAPGALNPVVSAADVTIFCRSSLIRS